MKKRGEAERGERRRQGPGAGEKRGRARRDRKENFLGRKIFVPRRSPSMYSAPPLPPRRSPLPPPCLLMLPSLSSLSLSILSPPRPPSLSLL